MERKGEMERRKANFNLNVNLSLVNLALYGISLAIKSMSVLSTSIKCGIFAPSSLNIHLC